MAMRRLWLLEDDAPLRGVIQDALSDEGWAVEICHSYSDLLEKAGGGAVAVADCWGPSQATLQPDERREIEALAAKVPLVLLTGRTWATRLEPPLVGVSAIVAKPFDVDGLLRALEAAAANHD